MDTKHKISPFGRNDNKIRVECFSFPRSAWEHMSLVLGRRLIGSHAERGNQYVHQKWDPGTIA